MNVKENDKIYVIEHLLALMVRSKSTKIRFANDFRLIFIKYHELSKKKPDDV